MLDTVRAANAMLGAVVDDARPVELDGDRLVLAFGEDAAFLRRKAEERANRGALGEPLRAVTGHALTLSYELREGDGAATPQPLSEDELVARLLDEFDAEVLAEHRRGGPLMPQPNMQQMLRQVQKMQADMARAQEELAAAEVEASAGGGMVTVA